MKQRRNEANILLRGLHKTGHGPRKKFILQGRFQ